VFSSFIAFGALHCVHKNWESIIKIHIYFSSCTSRSRKIIVIKFFEMRGLFLYLVVRILLLFDLLSTHDVGAEKRE